MGGLCEIEKTQRRPKKIEKQPTPTKVRIRFSSPNPPLLSTPRRLPRANDTISFDIDPLFTAKEPEHGTRRPAVTNLHKLDVSGSQKQAKASGSLKEPVTSGESKTKSAGPMSERIELANVDHWAALVEAETAPSTDRQRTKISEPSSPSTLRNTLTKISSASVPTPTIPIPEPERKQRLPVQTRQKQIEEENRRLLAEKEASRRAALEKQRIKEKEERDQQYSVVLGWMREKKMIKSFEQSLPRDREWDQLERQRYRLLASTFGITVPLRSHRSQPHTPIPHHSVVASPLPTTPQSFSPTSPMNFTGGDERHVDPSPLSSASMAPSIAFHPAQDRPVHVTSHDTAPSYAAATTTTTTTAACSPLVPGLMPTLPSITGHPSSLRDSLVDQKGLPASYAQRSSRSSPPDVSQPDTTSCSSGEIKPPVSDNPNPHPPPAISTTSLNTPGSFVVSTEVVANVQSSPPPTSAPADDHQPPKSVVASLGMTAPLADRTALMASVPVIASEPIQEVDMECDAEEGELSPS
ncbi:hypothetical protein IWQ61_000033 [Dispira simplex]|nr:hypothetical protein IWQ61_000033 [Dispira simplex]